MKDLMDYTLKEISEHCANHFAEAPIFAPTYFCEGCKFNDICDALQKETQNYLPMMWNFGRRTK